LNALGVYFEPSWIDPAFSRHYIQVPAGDSSEENGSIFILDLLEAAQTAPVAQLFPIVPYFPILFHFKRIPKRFRVCQLICAPCQVAGMN